MGYLRPETARELPCVAKGPFYPEVRVYPQRYGTETGRCYLRRIVGQMLRNHVPEEEIQLFSQEFQQAESPEARDFVIAKFVEVAI